MRARSSDGFFDFCESMGVGTRWGEGELDTACVVAPCSCGTRFMCLSADCYSSWNE